MLEGIHANYYFANKSKIQNNVSAIEGKILLEKFLFSNEIVCGNPKISCLIPFIINSVEEGSPSPISIRKLAYLNWYTLRNPDL